MHSLKTPSCAFFTKKKKKFPLKSCVSKKKKSHSFYTTTNSSKKTEVNSEGKSRRLRLHRGILTQWPGSRAHRELLNYYCRPRPPFSQDGLVSMDPFKWVPGAHTAHILTKDRNYA